MKKKCTCTKSNINHVEYLCHYCYMRYMKKQDTKQYLFAISIGIVVTGILTLILTVN